MSNLVNAVLIGAASALPLVLGAWIALERPPSSRVVGLISAFGAGALISAVSFDLALEASGKESPALLATALALGAIAYFLGSRYLDSRNKAGGASSRGLALLMGATLDGIPESLILGISIAAGLTFRRSLKAFERNFPAVGELSAGPRCRPWTGPQAARALGAAGR